MKPAQAMGLFLATWRAEWARLSRAQLAQLVCSQLHKPGTVTVNVVRKWEAGQPPKDLEELEALCQVMRRHMLTEQEVGHFRDAILAACLDRHYEGLFGDERLPPTAEVEALAPIGEMWNLVELLPRLRTLTQYVTEPPVRPCPPRLLRRWQEARVLLLAREWYLHVCAKRFLPAISAIRQSGELLAGVFGPGGLDGYMFTPAQMRVVEVHDRAFGLHEPGAGQRMLALAYEFRSEGETRHYALTLLNAVLALASADRPTFVYDDLQREIRWALGYLPDRIPTDQVCGTYFGLSNALMAEGDLRRAATYLPMMEGISHCPAAYPWSQGRFAYTAGDYDEAQRHLEHARDISQQRYGDWVAEEAISWLGKCDRAQHDVRHRGKGRTIRTQPGQQ